MKKFLFPIFIFASVFSANLSYGQGCSDAGFCTINSLKPNAIDSSVVNSKNKFKIGVSVGGADHSVSIFGNYIEYSRQFTDRFSLDTKITSLSQSGNEISAFGLSDIYLNGNFGLSKKSNLTIGFKVPLANGSKKKDNLPLPMDYQSSLGTFDIILGFGYAIDKFQLAAAIQQPLSQNKNAFFSEAYPLGSKLREFQSTNKFKRSGDILFRASYPFEAGEKFKITPSILPIFHLANDKYTNIFAKEVEIEGSQGFTLNANAYFDYEINSKNALQLSVGAPLVIRDVRPDGLTRSFVLNLEYKISF